MDVPKGDLEELLLKLSVRLMTKKILKLTKLLVPVNLLNEIKTKQNVGLLIPLRLQINAARHISSPFFLKCKLFDNFLTCFDLTENLISSS